MNPSVRVVPVHPGSRPMSLAEELARRVDAQLVEGWDDAVTALAAEAAAGPGARSGDPVGADAAMELRRRARAAQRSSVLASTVATALVTLRRSLARLPAIDADPNTIRLHAEEVAHARRRAEGAASVLRELEVDREALAVAEEADRTLARVDRRHAMVGQAARGLAIASVGLALMVVGSRSASAAVAAGIVVAAVAAGGWWWITSRRRVAAMERRTREAMAEVGATSWQELDALLSRRAEWEVRFGEALEAQRQVRTAMATWEQVAGELDPEEVEAVAELARERAAATEALGSLDYAAEIAAARHVLAAAKWQDALAAVGQEVTTPGNTDRVLASLPHHGLVITAPDAEGPRAHTVRDMLRTWEGRPVWVVARDTHAWEWDRVAPPGG